MSRCDSCADGKVRMVKDRDIKCRIRICYSFRIFARPDDGIIGIFLFNDAPHIGKESFHGDKKKKLL